MEKKLARLFEFQDFEGNSQLSKVIDDVHQRYQVRELTMDEMEMLAAAGNPLRNEREKRSQKDRHKKSGIL